MNARRVLLLSAVLACVAGAAVAQTEWVDDPANPVVPPADPGAWDAYRLVNTVIEVDGMYHLFFQGQAAGSSLLEDSAIGHAISPDGTGGWLIGEVPVLTPGAAGEWDDRGVACGAVIHDGVEFRMWYSGGDGERRRVGYATSPGGWTWTKHAGNPIMDVGGPGSFDDQGVWPGTVLFDGVHYRMWYTGEHGVGPDDRDWRIGCAESDDGLSWTRQPLPVLDPGAGWDRWLVFAPSVLFDGSTYHMWYSAVDGVSSVAHAVGYAVSSDGLHWTRHWGNPVVEGSGLGVELCDVLRDPASGVFEMWYSDLDDYSFRKARSECCATVYLSFVPAAAHAAGSQGSFFQTDLDLSNADGVAVGYQLWWLPRGEDNSEPTVSDSFNLGAGMSVRYGDVLAEVFGLGSDAFGGLAIVSSSPHLLAMSRTYNLPGDGASGSYGQSMPGIAPEELIRYGGRRRILFGTENADMRTNIGCQNGGPVTTVVTLELFAADGTPLRTQYLGLLPWGNDQLNRVFADHRPVTGYVDVVNEIPNTSFTCYGSVLDNITNDPMTIMPR